MTNKLFHCIACGRNSTVKTMRTVLKPGKDAGVSMHFYTAKCPKCGSRMMKIQNIVRVTKKHR